VTRFQLEHIIRAAAASANVREIVVIGSQAILGSFPHPPERLQQSMDADVYPKDRPELSIVIDGAIGELSIFHSTFGYYAHGVGEETAILPLGWAGRLVKVENENTFGAIGWCLEVHDLAVSKLIAGRDKDVDFVGVMMGAGMVKVSILKERLQTTYAEQFLIQRASGWIHRLFLSEPGI
jgi:hypothetical protein